MNNAWVVGIAAGMLFSGAAGELRAQTLEEALVSAYLTNSDLEAQRASLRATDELVPQALSDWRPTLSVDSTAAYADIDSSEGSGTLGTAGSSIILDQDVYNGGETVANTNRAESLVRLERARLQAIEQQVLLNAVAAYTNLLSTQSVLEFARQNEDRLRRQLQATRDRFEVGEVTRTDVAQAEASLSGAVAARVQAEGQVQAAEAAYRQVVNQEPIRLIRPQPLMTLPGTQAEAQELAQAFNPNITAAQYDLAASRADVRVQESALLPRVSIQGELGYTHDPSLSLDYQSVGQIGANLTVPLYQGGGEYARVRQSKATVRQRQEDLESVFRSVRQEVTDAWQTLTSARTALESFREQVRAAEIAVEGTPQEALVGQRTTLDVLDQEQDLFQAQVDLVNAAREEILARYRLKAAVGELTATGVGLPVEPYNPEAHYERVRDKLFGLGPDIDGGD
jgi:TolC family type I secretion outer membrane protein